jgi:hypothetical protein
MEKGKVYKRVSNLAARTGLVIPVGGFGVFYDQTSADPEDSIFEDGGYGYTADFVEATEEEALLFLLGDKSPYAHKAKPTSPFSLAKWADIQVLVTVREGMVAENVVRASRGDSPAYNENAFFDLASEIQEVIDNGTQGEVKQSLSKLREESEKAE